MRSSLVRMSFITLLSRILIVNNTFSSMFSCGDCAGQSKVSMSLSAFHWWVNSDWWGWRYRLERHWQQPVINWTPNTQYHTNIFASWYFHLLVAKQRSYCKSLHKRLVLIIGVSSISAHVEAYSKWRYLSNVSPRHFLLVFIWSSLFLSRHNWNIVESNDNNKQTKNPNYPPPS